VGRIAAVVATPAVVEKREKLDKDCVGPVLPSEVKAIQSDSRPVRHTVDPTPIEKKRVSYETNKFGRDDARH
jgi:hypothetical protein